MMKESVKPRSLPDKPAGPSSNKEPSKTRRASRPRSEMDTPLHCFDHGSWRSQVLIVRSFFYGRLMDVGTSRVRWRHLGKSWRDFVQLLCLVQRASVVQILWTLNDVSKSKKMLIDVRRTMGIGFSLHMFFYNTSTQYCGISVSQNSLISCWFRLFKVLILVPGSDLF